MLHSTRERLVKSKAGFINLCSKRISAAYRLNENDIDHCKPTELIKNFDRQIEKLMMEIETIIEERTNH